METFFSRPNWFRESRSITEHILRRQAPGPHWIAPTRRHSVLQHEMDLKVKRESFILRQALSYLNNIRSAKHLIFDWLVGALKTFFHLREGHLRRWRHAETQKTWIIECKLSFAPFSAKVSIFWANKTEKLSARLPCRIIIKRFKYRRRCWCLLFYVSGCSPALSKHAWLGPVYLSAYFKSVNRAAFWRGPRRCIIMNSGER